MAKIRLHEPGFSLVELLVALVFTMVLMAGMAKVFKASLSQYYTSGESLSSARRNRMSVDLLVDDLNAGCMYLTDLTNPPLVQAPLLPFFILPNMPVTTDGKRSSTQVTDDSIPSANPVLLVGDEVYFYLDQPLPFEGTLGSTAANQTAADLVMSGQAPPANNNTYTIDCGNYASLVKKGQVFLFKDSWETGYINTDPGPPSGNSVTVKAEASPNAAITGAGSTGLPSKTRHLQNSGIVFVTPAQMVRYRIQMLQLDPDPEHLKPNGIPCLVRDQGSYVAQGDPMTTEWVSDPGVPQQVITENVSGFKVYLSTNAGASWAGIDPTTKKGALYSGYDKGWDQGIRTEVDNQLAATGRSDFKTTRTTEHWFRSIPTMVRVDLTTRTATPRTEYEQSTDDGYDKTKPKRVYRNLTQSLVFVPRHSGLPMN